MKSDRNVRVILSFTDSKGDDREKESSCHVHQSICIPIRTPFPLQFALNCS